MRRVRQNRKAAGKEPPLGGGRYPSAVTNGEELRETFAAAAKVLADLPASDNTEGAVEQMLRANALLRYLPWPKPFDETVHRLRCGDARDLSWLPDGSVHLVVTSPPYWTLKEYEPHEAQLGAIADYETFLAELDKVWAECARVLAPGGRICCVVGDVCIPRKREGRHYVMPLHADIQTRSRRLGLDCLTPILWQKIANGAMEAEGNGAGFYGKPYQPGAIIKNDVEHILFLRKGGEYRSPSAVQRALSMLNREEMRAWMRSFWTDVKGESTRKGHPAPFPVVLAERLIKMFSFAGDTVLDPFAGTGTTALAALNCGRNSISLDIEPKYAALAHERLREAAFLPSGAGPSRIRVVLEERSRENASGRPMGESTNIQFKKLSKQKGGF
ncbi:DNA methylase N-4/N-6 domain protein (modular protein) [Verrucomicrobia bacterium]|nr:DNA methylase N-4/N-6 domain protein (modular protein) [Verrucomicrobiota bacterium]